MAKKTNAKAKTNRSLPSGEAEFLYADPLQAARHIDSLMKVIQRRYGDTSGGAANLGNFLITRVEVVFSPKIQSITLEKRAESQSLLILAPVVTEDSEELRRIELLNAFGELILKFQKQAYLQIREMLLQILDDEGKRILREDFAGYLAEMENQEQVSEVMEHQESTSTGRSRKLSFILRRRNGDE